MHVSSDSLPRCISSLRTRLGSDECIQTLYKRGYRFLLPVEQTKIDPPAEVRIERRVLSRGGIPRLVILPFETSAGVPESYGPGIAEEVMIRLSRSRTPAVDVLARDSVFALHARSKTAQQVGRELHADLALTGSMTAMPLHFRLRAEMFRVEDNVQVWVEDFLLPRELLAYADARIAKRITARMLDAFDTSTQSNPRQNQRVSLQAAAQEGRRSEAYDAYLQASHQWNTRERHQMQDALRGMQRAIELDGSLVSARILLMHSYLEHAGAGYMRADTAAEAARKQAEAALTQMPGGYMVHPALGWIHFYHDRDLAAASAAFARGEAPGQYAGQNAATTDYRVRFLLGRYCFSEAIDLLRAALRTDAHSPALHQRLAWALHLAGDSVAALKQAEAALAHDPGDAGTALVGASVLGARSGGNDELSARAVALAQQVVQIAPYRDAAHATLAYAQARNGELGDALSILERQRWLSRERFVMRSCMVPALVELGEYDAAIAELTTAEEQHCPWFFETLADPRLQALHGRPGFERLRSVGQELGSSASVA